MRGHRLVRLVEGRGRLMAPDTRGALGILLALFLFALMDATAKHLSQSLPSMQIVWARYFSQTVMIALLFLPNLPKLVTTAQLGMQVVRGLFLFGATSLFFTSLGFLDLAEAAALLQTAPLIIVVLAALVLREKVGPRRWIAVGIGLCGALILLRPGAGVFQAAAFLGLGAAFFLASYQVATRMLGGADSIWTTLIYTTLVGAVLATLVLPFFWVTPTWEQAVLMCVIGLPGLIGHFALVWALQQAEASALAPFNYSGLVWAMLIGLLVFGEVPDTAVLTGASVIVAAGIYVWHRERVVRAAAGEIAAKAGPAE